MTCSSTSQSNYPRNLRGEKFKERYAWLRELFVPAGELLLVVPVAKSVDTDITVVKFINYHIRIRGEMEPIQQILDRGKPSFQNIWAPDARNSDIARPFKDQMAAAFPVRLVATGYSAGGKTYPFSCQMRKIRLF